MSKTLPISSTNSGRICRGLMALAVFGAFNLATTAFCLADPNVVREADPENDDSARDAQEPASRAVDFFNQIAFGSLRTVPAEAATTLRRALASKISAIDLICNLSPEQKQKLELAGKGDTRRLLEQIERQLAELRLIEDGELRFRRQEIMQKAIVLRDALSDGPFGDRSLFDKTLQGRLTRDQAAQFAPFRKMRGLSRALDVRANPRGRNEIVGIRFTAAPVTDEQLSALKQLTALENLWLCATQITDAGLAHLANMAQLEQLDLAGTRIEGPGLVHLKGLRKLKTLNLKGTLVTGVGLEALADLPNLRSLLLGGAPLAEPGIEPLKNLNRLEVLSLRGTKITDAWLPGLGQLRRLRQLELDGTLVTDAGLVHLASLQELRMLDLRGALVTDAGLVALARLDNLNYLCLFDAHVTAAGVAALKQSLPRLRADR